MDSTLLSNKTAVKVKLTGDCYVIEVAVKKSYVADFHTYSFLLKARHSNLEYTLNHNIKTETEDFFIISLNFTIHSFSELIQDGYIWDLYIQRSKEDKTATARIKQLPEHLQFLSYPLDVNKVFYPYRTSKGNLSFRTNTNVMFASLEEVHLKNTGELHFAGSFNYFPFFHAKNAELVNLSLIVTNNLDERKEMIIPLSTVSRRDLADKYGASFQTAGFKGTFDTPKYLNPEENTYFKFYVELRYKDEQGIHNVRSIRMRHIKKDRNLPAAAKIKLEGKQVQIRVRLTKKSNYLQVRGSEYKFIRETKAAAVNKLIRIRRSNKLKAAYKKAFKIAGKVIPVNQKLIMFESFLGKQYSDNPRAIYEYILENHPEYKMFWSADRRAVNYFENKDVPYIRRFTVKWLIAMTRARFWVTNSRLPLWIPKPKHTIYLQTWHGTPLKRLASDMDEVHMPGTNTEKYKRNFISEAAKWDYLISPNRYSSEIFTRAFQFNKTMIESGYPRNDFLYTHNTPENIEMLRKSMGLPERKKIILYAPTWRDNQFYQKGKYKFDLELDLEMMREELGNDYIVILRLHYLVAENLDLSRFEGFAYDLSSYEDIRELYLVSDLLITDYSSVFFDYANLRRPIMFFVYDIDEYRDNLRGFYFDFEAKAPGPLFKKTNSIIEAIKENDRTGFQPDENFEAFADKFCYLEDGNASARVVNEVLKPSSRN